MLGKSVVATSKKVYGETRRSKDESEGKMLIL